MRHSFDLKNIIIDTFLECGACISHHHGIGKKNKDKYLEVAGRDAVELSVLRAVKQRLDPKNIFANANCYTETEETDAYAMFKHKL